jgi:hypothetical protein
MLAEYAHAAGQVAGLLLGSAEDAFADAELNSRYR